MKHIKENTDKKSLLYLFFENDVQSQHIKIGMTSHYATDNAIKGRKRYADSEHPVSIQRRIIQFQTGSPRQIKPLAYFLYPTIKEAKTVEKNLQKQFIHKKSEFSKEWFSLSFNEINEIITCLKDTSTKQIANCQKTNVFWVDENKMNETQKK